jgi:hypothetical protein
VVDIKKKKNILVLGLNIGIKKESIPLASIEYLMKSQSQKPLASLHQSIGHVYDDLAGDEDPHLLPRTNTTQ